MTDSDDKKTTSNKTVNKKNEPQKTPSTAVKKKPRPKKKIKPHPVFEEAHQPMIHDHPLTQAEQQGALFVPPVIERPAKLEGGVPFKLVSDYEPAGDQPQAIEELYQGIQDGEQSQVLLGVTGSGKTFTMAQVIAKTQRPALILAHNKTLAAQLYEEFKNFFPNNSVEYFVSYYDYYQPEAYVPRSDTYIEKDSSINEQIDRMRHAATRAVMERDDVIIVASVSCIYGIGSVETYIEMTLTLEIGQMIAHRDLISELVTMQYKRNDIDFRRGTFRVRGDTIELWPAHLEDRAWRISLFGDEIDGLMVFDPLTGQKSHDRTFVKIYANSHHVTPHPTMKQAVKKIQMELDARLEELKSVDKLVELQRLDQRVNFDMEMMMASGSCAGVENYSRYLSGRNPGEPPPTLFEFLPENCLLFVDESHVSVPQIGAMFKGDFRRKTTLAQYGFRLPSCMDNRPLRFEEWDAIRPQTVFVTATPAPWELDQTQGVFVEQIIRPTGLIDPPVEIRPAGNQVDDVMDEIHKVIAKNQRILVTTLTKKMAEDLTEYMHDQNIGVRYMHSDVDTLERIEIIRDLRLGVFDVLIGINLLREGLDIPECALVAILDADKEGFLRSETSLVQTIGRAARNVEGRVILYADRITGSMERAIAETDRRREKQKAHNEEHGITPRSTVRAVAAPITGASDEHYSTESAAFASGFSEDGQAAFDSSGSGAGNNLKTVMADLDKRMKEAAADLEFETAAKLRDELQKLRASELLYGKDMLRKQLAEDKEG